MTPKLMLSFLLCAIMLVNSIYAAPQAVGIGYSEPFTIDRRVKPVITSIDPVAGTTKGGTTVTVKGDKFYTGLTTVELDGQTVASVNIKSESEFSFKTTQANAGLVDLEVFNPNGVSTQLSQAFKYQAPRVETVTVTPASPSLVANGVATMSVVIRLLDQNGEVIEDETINLVVDRGKINSQATNNKDGTYTATYTASQTEGTATITAVTSTHGQTGSAELKLTTRKVSVDKSSLSLVSKWAMMGPPGTQLTVKVVDQQGLSMAGQIVTAILEPSVQATVGQAAATDAEGQTQLNIQSEIAGDRQVTVKVGSMVLKQTIIVKFTSNQVATAEVSTSGVKKVGELVTVGITLLNADQLPVSGQQVEVLVEPDEGVILTQPKEASDDQGQLEAQLLSERAGLKTVKLEVGNAELDVNASLIFQAGPVDKVKISADKGSLLPQQTGLLTLTVVDQYGNPLKGQAPKVQTTLGELGAVTDQEDGTYNVTFIAPPETGSAIVTASLAGKSSNLGLQITDKPALTISPMQAQVELGQTIQFEASQSVLWTVRDKIGTIDNQGLFTASQLGITRVTAFLQDDPTIKISSQTIAVVEAKLPTTALAFDLPKQVEFGLELDIKGQLIVVDQPDRAASDQAITIVFVKPSQKSLKFVPKTDTEGRYTLNTAVKFNEVGVWQLALSYAGSTQYAKTQRQQAISVVQAEPSLRWLSTESAELGQQYLLVGALQPAVAATEVAVQILDPDSRLLEQQLVTDAAGGFKHQFKLDLDGRWSVTVSWTGDANYQAVTETFQLKVVKQFGKVIIGLGGAGPSEVHAWSKLKSTAESVYQAFVSRNFNPEQDIYFLSSDPTQTEGANGQTTLKTLEFAITNWAAKEVNQNVPLYIYLLSHNLRDKFLVERRELQDDYLTSDQLDLWLDKLPEGTPVTLIIEACYSGNFINDRLSHPNRTIITSASADKQAMIMRSSSFTRFFFDLIRANNTIEQAFSQSKDKMERFLAHRTQSPQIDVNGNGIANELLDLQALGERRIPADISSLSLPPTFGQQIAAVTLETGANRHQFEVEIVGSEVEEVTAEILQPGFDSNQPFLEWKEIEKQVQVVELTRVKAEETSSQYLLDYQGFDQMGGYTIIFQAKNVDGYAEPIQTTVTVPEAGKQLAAKLTGDVNSDGTVNIFDLVIAAGSFGKTGVGIMGDVNADGSVNIFDLVIVAGNFGQSAVAAAPSMVARIELSTEQKHHIAHAIDQLEYNSNRSSTEEMALNVLKDILPERLPTQTQLLPNYPNPFNPETWIPFQLSQDVEVSLQIYDSQGRLVRKLELGWQVSGYYTTTTEAIYWDGRNTSGELVSSGVYFYRLQAGDYSQVHKMVILK